MHATAGAALQRSPAARPAAPVGMAIAEQMINRARARGESPATSAALAPGQSGLQRIKRTPR